MDTIFLRALTLDAVIGVNTWERVIRQRLRLDLEFSADVAAAAANDTLEGTLDYAAIAGRARALAAQAEFQLLESLAEHLADRLRQEFALAWVRLSLAKPGAVPGAEAVGVVIERGEKVAG